MHKTEKITIKICRLIQKIQFMKKNCRVYKTYEYATGEYEEYAE